MAVAYPNIITESLILYNIGAQDENLAPKDLITKWCSEYPVSFEPISTSECRSMFTACHCEIDLEQEQLTRISDSTNETPTLRTQLLLYTEIKGRIFIVGVCETYQHLSYKQDSVLVIRFSQITDAGSFLEDVSKQKMHILRSEPVFFSSAPIQRFGYNDFELYRDALKLRLECMENSIIDIDSFDPRVFGETLEYALFMYTSFAASASDKLVENLISMQVYRFQNRLLQYTDIPWLRFAFVLRYLGVEWESIQTNHYEDIFTLQLDNDYDLMDSAIYAAQHCSTEKAYSDFYFKVHAQFSPVRSPFHCPEHNHACNKTLTMQRGMHIVPYGYLEYCARKMIAQRIHVLCNRIRRTYGTREAFTIWKSSARNAADFLRERLREEPMIHPDSFIRDPGVIQSAVHWFKKLKAARQFPDIVCAFDHKLIRQEIIPFWDNVLFFRYSSSLDRNYDVRTGVKYNGHGRLSAAKLATMPIDFSQLKQFAQQYWSPCINNLVAKCHGGHLRYRQRNIVIRFLLSPVVDYSIEQAAHLWRLFFEASDVYQGDDKFWSSKYGQAFTNFAKGDRETFKFWPPCSVIVKEQLCPLMDELRDIEDSVVLLKKRKQVCLGNAKQTLKKLARATKLRNPSVSSPMSYALITHVSYAL